MIPYVDAYARYALLQGGGQFFDATSSAPLEVIWFHRNRGGLLKAYVCSKRIPRECTLGTVICCLRPYRSSMMVAVGVRVFHRFKCVVVLNNSGAVSLIYGRDVREVLHPLL